MIKLERLLSNTPIPILGSLKFYQPNLQQIVDMGEEMYWSMIKIWCLDRKDMVAEETDKTKQLTDLEIWKAFVFNSPDMQVRFIGSIDCFLHTKVEFLPTVNTIIIGEDDSTVVVDEAFYSVMRDICSALSSLGEEKKEEQYRETENMSEREKEMIRKMKAREEKLNAAKNNKKVDNRLAKQIVSLVAIGEYTFDEVYAMTLIQMVYLLKKYTAIQQYVLYTGLSPYMDSKKSKPIEHWLDA